MLWYTYLSGINYRVSFICNHPQYINAATFRVQVKSLLLATAQTPIPTYRHLLCDQNESTPAFDQLLLLCVQEKRMHFIAEYDYFSWITHSVFNLSTNLYCVSTHWGEMNALYSLSILCTDLLSHVISSGGQITVLVAGARHSCALVSCLCHPCTLHKTGICPC